MKKVRGVFVNHINKGKKSHILIDVNSFVIKVSANGSLERMVKTFKRGDYIECQYETLEHNGYRYNSLVSIVLATELDKATSENSKLSKYHDFYGDFITNDRVVDDVSMHIGRSFFLNKDDDRETPF